MLVLFGGHFLEELARARIGLAQARGEFGIDAPILLLGGDGEREDFALGQRGEVAPVILPETKHGRPLP